jgi:hypothetical protein
METAATCAPAFSLGSILASEACTKHVYPIDVAIGDNAVVYALADGRRWKNVLLSPEEVAAESCHLWLDP